MHARGGGDSCRRRGPVRPVGPGGPGKRRADGSALPERGEDEAGALTAPPVHQVVVVVEEPAPTPVDVTLPTEVPDGSLVVLAGEDERGREVVLSHPDEPALRSLAVLDVVLNSSDRKGGHVLLDERGVHGIDNGVSLHVEPKLRTVLWGWAGQPLTEPDRARVESVLRALEDCSLSSDLTDLLDKHARGEDTDEDFREFMDKHGDAFPEHPQNVDELIDSAIDGAAYFAIFGELAAVPDGTWRENDYTKLRDAAIAGGQA